MRPLREVIRDWRRSVEEETGEPYPLVAAERDIDQALFAHEERIAGTGYCLGCLVCEGTNVEVREQEIRELAVELLQEH